MVLAKIKSLLYDEGYSIAGLQKLLIKRKKSNLKEQNIEFLSMNESPSNQMPEDHNDFSLDNFIPQAPSIKIDNLDSGSQESVEKIIARIELNLKKLEEIW